jgi:hypothetical protein
MNGAVLEDGGWSKTLYVTEREQVAKHEAPILEMYRVHVPTLDGGGKWWTSFPQSPTAHQQLPT